MSLEKVAAVVLSIVLMLTRGLVKENGEQAETYGFAGRWMGVVVWGFLRSARRLQTFTDSGRKCEGVGGVPS